MLAHVEDFKSVLMKTPGNISENGKADVLERFGATLFEIQDHFQEALFSKELSDDDKGDTLRLVQKKYAFEHATVRRLRSKLREKEKLLMSLQTAIEDACETALDQQNKDRKEIENLHGVLSMKDNRSLEEIKSALKDLIKQEPEAAKGLAGDLAHLLEEKLSDLLSGYEGKVEELQDSLDCWKKRCEELEKQVEEGKKEQQMALKDANTQELQLDQSLPKRSEVFVEKLKLRLSVKECKVKQLMDRIKGLELQLARALDSQVDTNLQRSISQNYECARRKSIYLEDLVSKLKQEVQHLKNVAASNSKKLATDNPNVKRLQKDLDVERARAQALALELAHFQSKMSESKSPRQKPTMDNSRPEAKVEKLKGVVNELTAKICKLQHTYHELSSKYQGVRVSTGSREVFDEFCLTHSARDLETKEVHAKLVEKIRELQKKLTLCQEDLKVNEINKQFFEEKLNTMEERALKAELRLAEESKGRKGQPLQFNETQQLSQRGELNGSSQNSRPRSHSERTLLEDDSSELFELTEVLNDNEKNLSMTLMCGSRGEQDKVDEGNTGRTGLDGFDGQRRFLFANESMILELNLANGVAQCKLLAKRKLKIKTDVDVPRKERCLRGFSRRPKLVPESDMVMDTLKQELEQLRTENMVMKENRPSNIQYMNLVKKSKETAKALTDLQAQIEKATKIDPYMELITIQDILTGLRGGLKRWSGNSPWVQALAKLEACCVNIEKKLTSTFVTSINKTILKPRNMKENTCKPNILLRASKDHTLKSDSALAQKLEEQAEQLKELQTELSQKLQAITNLNIQLDRRDNELNLMHGHMSLANVQDKALVIYGEKQHNSQPPAMSDNATMSTSAYCEQLKANAEILQMENNKQKIGWSADLTAGSREMLGREEDIQLELSEVYKMCSIYEQMLHKYTTQLGISFEPIRF